MSRSGLRGVAGGLFLGTILCATAYYFFEESNAQTTAPSHTVSTDEMVLTLEEKGYLVLTEDELAAQQETLIDESSPSQSEHQSTIIYAMTLSIEPGMSSQQVANRLARGNVIKDESEFLAYLSSHDLIHSLRVGTYDLTSEMSLEEIADAIT
ncbi:endolytic transglycosylase MltG [Halalkalibacterium ligniniphilum]|uniref:endolytic transglycosylase MltG n=1 Tax=Halalkalibacterium ligniniphilum TaxID=1134413 RepID=UPI000344AEB3|nr:endolytic transglycosylase MltG [Halalkalibacterium ligniniphilum]